jgi:hypothetical protein
MLVLILFTYFWYNKEFVAVQFTAVHASAVINLLKPSSFSTYHKV